MVGVCAGGLAFILAAGAYVDMYGMGGLKKLPRRKVAPATTAATRDTSRGAVPLNVDDDGSHAKPPSEETKQDNSDEEGVSLVSIGDSDKMDGELL